MTISPIFEVEFFLFPSEITLYLRACDFWRDYYSEIDHAMLETRRRNLEVRTIPKSEESVFSGVEVALRSL
jgi:hypothetical protein